MAQALVNILPNVTVVTINLQMYYTSCQLWMLTVLGLLVKRSTTVLVVYYRSDKEIFSLASC